jgi:ribonucleoside-diphosphate reductase alpha chain
VAYVARLIIHRYAMLGVLDEQGLPLVEMGLLQAPIAKSASANGGSGSLQVQAGKPCPECGNATMIHKDGCDFCTACGYVGQCG